MIISIGIKNFQSHKSSVLNLHPGINAIVGVSDAGKSAVLRAFHWVRENRPLGDAHISDWAKDGKGKVQDACSVSIQTDAYMVSRIRGKDKTFNGYTVESTANGGTVESLEAIKTEVPARVTEILNLDTVNVQKQLDAPFLLASSPPEVARFFNGIVKLQDMDRTMSAVEGKKRDNEKAVIVANAEIARHTARVESLQWVDKAAPMVAEAEALNKQIVLNERTVAKIHNLVYSGRQSQALIDSTAQTVALEPKVKVLRSMAESIVANQIKGQKLEQAITKARFLEHDIGELAQTLSAIPMVHVAKQTLATLVPTAARVASYRKLIASANEASAVVAKHAPALQAEAQANTARELMASIKRESTKVEAIRALIHSARGHELIIAQHAGAVEVTKPIQRAKGLLTRLVEAKKALNSVAVLLDAGRRHTAEIGANDAEIIRLEALRPKTCPTCGQAIKSYNAHGDHK